MIAVTADSFATLADRRAYLGALADTRTRITTTPTRKRLTAANDNKKLAALDAYDALQAPHSPIIGADTNAEPMRPNASGKGWRMRPDESEMEAALALCRVVYRTALGRTHGERMAGGSGCHVAHDDGATWRIGPLVFTKTRRSERALRLIGGEVVTADVLVPAGAMVARGVGKRGQIRKPSEYRTYPRSEKEGNLKAELAGRRAVSRYLRLRGTWEGYESWTDRVGGPGRSVERPPAARILAKAYANTAVLPEVTRCPTAILADGHWLGGVTRSSGLATGHDSHAKAIAAEATRMTVQRYLAESLSEEDRRVLDLANSNATEAEAAESFGITRRAFRRRFDAAIERFQKKLAA